MARIYGYIDYMATIRPLLALSPSFLIAANLCEIVNVAINFTIRYSHIDRIFYANLYLFYRSKKIEFA